MASGIQKVYDIQTPDEIGTEAEGTSVWEMLWHPVVEHEDTGRIHLDVFAEGGERGLRNRTRHLGRGIGSGWGRIQPRYDGARRIC